MVGAQSLVVQAKGRVLRVSIQGPGKAMRGSAGTWDAKRMDQ